MEVILEPNTVSDRIKAFLDDPERAKHIKDSQLKQIKRRIFSNIKLNFEFFELPIVGS
jgi:hypothetical protein